MNTDKANLVAMWQTYVETAENTSTRREAINRYMVPVHLAIIASHFVLSLADLDHVFVGLAGMGVSYLWVSLIDAHSQINKVKYEIINELEVAPALPTVHSGIRA